MAKRKVIWLALAIMVGLCTSACGYRGRKFEVSANGIKIYMNQAQCDKEGIRVKFRVDSAGQAGGVLKTDSDRFDMQYNIMVMDYSGNTIATEQIGDPIEVLEFSGLGGTWLEYFIKWPYKEPLPEDVRPNTMTLSLSFKTKKSSKRIAIPVPLQLEYREGSYRDK